MRESIAITGIGCRFPGANSPSEFWRLLLNGHSVIRTLPPSRQGRQNSDIFPGGWLDDVESFDPEYFGIPPEQARVMDPQQRLMLEVAASAIEDAGTSPLRLAGPRTGVFAGISTHDFAILFWTQARPHPNATSGTSDSAAANRISHWLGASGPSVVIDTACSSALTALHYACRSIRSGEIDVAIVGAASVLLIPLVTEGFARAGFISRSGVCRSLDRNADGYVRGEGAAAVVLKRGMLAERERDRVYAEIRGSAVNHNGFSNGLTAPNPAAQAEVIRSACLDGGVVPSDLQYIEAMGSGTVLGDAIELRGIARAVGADINRDHRCIIGSVKANIGHLEAASGMAALIKTALSLRHGKVPSTPNLSAPSEAFWPGALLTLSSDVVEWPDRSLPRLAGVNSFGFGGANAHVVLASAASQEEIVSVDPPVTHVLLLSAKTEAGLRVLRNAYISFLQETNESITDICYTASAGRPHHRFRTAVSGKDKRELAGALSGESTAVVVAERFPKLVFQLPDLTTITDQIDIEELKRLYPPFRRAFESCTDIVEGASECLAFQYGMAMLLMEMGLRPAMIMCQTSSQRKIASVVPEIAIVEQAVRPASFRYALEIAPNGRLIGAAGVAGAWPSTLWISLYKVGAPIKWDQLYAGTGARKVTIPGHPRVNQPFWFEVQSETAHRTVVNSAALLGEIEHELDSLGY